MWLHRMCLYVWESGLPHNYINCTISIQTGIHLKAKRSNASNYIKHKSRPSWQTETYVYTICNEPQTVPIPLQTVLNDPRPLLWKHILFTSCWRAETSIYSQQADFLPGRKALSQHRQFGLRKRIVLRTTCVLGEADRVGQQEVRGFTPEDVCLSKWENTSGARPECSSPPLSQTLDFFLSTRPSAFWTNVLH